MTFWDLVRIYTDIDSECVECILARDEVGKQLAENPGDVGLKIKCDMLDTKIKRKKELKEIIQRIEIARSVWEGLKV